MATDVTAQTRAQSSTFPMMVLIAGWLIPGAVHLMFRKWIRGSLLMFSIVAMFCIGLALKGKIYSPNTGDLLDILNFAGDLGNGLLYVLARLFDLGQVTVQVATAEGYTAKPDAHTAFHGYYFRMLKGQSDKAPGGAKDFVVNGKMTGGFAFVAYPAEYGNSGIMTFMINQDGVLLQKDLGKTTPDTANAMSVFDPDSSWTIVEP